MVHLSPVMSLAFMVPMPLPQVHDTSRLRPYLEISQPIQASTESFIAAVRAKAAPIVRIMM